MQGDARSRAVRKLGRHDQIVHRLPESAALEINADDLIAAQTRGAGAAK
ncbi:MAG: hypothetical protein ACREEB_11580 [Caulobacteraceae bacterium]